jgi:DNA-binding HxlR family transcriptional regulator
MEKVDNEMVHMLQPDSRKGELIIKRVYEKWSRFILSSLDTEKDLTLSDLLERAHQDFKGINDHETGWHVLQVKRDLEARGLIKVIAAPDHKRTFFIKLTRQGLAKIHYETQLPAWSEG